MQDTFARATHSAKRARDDRVSCIQRRTLLSPRSTFRRTHTNEQLRSRERPIAIVRTNDVIQKCPFPPLRHGNCDYLGYEQYFFKNFYA